MKGAGCFHAVQYRLIEQVAEREDVFPVFSKIDLLYKQNR